MGPEHCYLKDTGRASYVSATDAEALDAFQAREPARRDHPRARDRARLRLACGAMARPLARGRAGAGLLSGRGDKDVAHVASLLGAPV